MAIHLKLITYLSTQKITPVDIYKLQKTLPKEALGALIYSINQNSNA